jgi:hypothetical protein
MTAPENSSGAAAGATGDDLETLRALWRVHAKSLLALVESGGPLKAAERAAVTAFLRDNGINRDTIKKSDVGQAMRALVGDLNIPHFEDHE